MKKKMRVQLLSKEGIVQSDRLVDQTTEFYAGPKSEHDGQLKIEFHLENTDDIDRCIKYLNQLKGAVPVKQTRAYGNSSTKPNEMSRDQREELLTTALDKGKDQDKLIGFLRDHGFRFMMQDFADALKLDFGCKKAHKDKYQWMVRCIKEAKDPANDKYDPQLVFGIKMLPERSAKVVIYFYGEFHSKVEIEVPKKADFNFKTTSISKFPKFMSYDEREKWRAEHRKLMNNPEMKKSKFYRRWEKDIQLGDTLKIPTNEAS